MKTFGVGIGIVVMCASIPIPTPTFPVVVLFSEQTAKIFRPDTVGSCYLGRLPG